MLMDNYGNCPGMSKHLTMILLRGNKHPTPKVPIFNPSPLYIFVIHIHKISAYLFDHCYMFLTKAQPNLESEWDIKKLSQILLGAFESLSWKAESSHATKSKKPELSVSDLINNIDREPKFEVHYIQ